MSRRIAFPFLTLSDNAVNATPWLLSLDGGEWAEMSEYLSDWDPSSVIRLKRTIRFLPEVIEKELSMPIGELDVALSVRLGTGQGRLPRRILNKRNHSIDAASRLHSLEFKVDGTNLSSILDLQTEVILNNAPRSTSSLSPRFIGARLWGEVRRLRLEGEEPRFPIEVTNFNELLGGQVTESAPWYLFWSPHDWDRDFHGAVRLFLNEKRTDFIERIENQDQMTLQVLMADIVGQVCERFILDSESPLIMQNPEPGSIGAQAASWINKAWPDRDIAYVRSILESRPGLFYSTLMALSELGED